MEFKLSNDSRSRKAQKNILVSCVLKGGDTLIYLLLVPLTLGYLNPYEYGIWLALNSILAWINSFDIGLGNGLRNKLAEAIALNDHEQARKYVSTTFFMLIGLVIIILGIGYFILTFVDWYSVLSVNEGTVDNLDEIILVSFMFFCLNFVLKFIGNVYQALQIPFAMYLFNFLGHLLALVLIYILTITTTRNLFLVALIYSASSPLVYLAAYPVTFKVLYKYLAPSISYWDKNCIKELFNLSIAFFIMQLATLVLFSMSNLLVSNMFGPTEVTPFSIAQRYFSLIPMLINIVLAPIWSASTDAYTRGDYEWIIRVNKSILKIILLLSIVFPIMVLVSPIVYKVWIGNQVKIPFSISVLSALFNFIFIWSLSYSVILNGMGKLRLQMIVTVAVSIIFCPVSFYFGGIFGVAGILLGMCMVNLPGAIINTIQFQKIVSHRAKGVWNK